MSSALVFLTFLVAVVVLTVLAKRLRIPYPIAFVIGGVGLAFSRHLPHPHFDPDFVLLLVLPPLLYSAAWSTDWVLLRRNWQMVTLLAIGLVLFTMLAVGLFIHITLPKWSWALAFTLGAIVSPPDAVAAEAIFETLAVPRRLAAIITGECLFNDATALVLYRFAVVALIAGTFSLAQAGWSFVYVAAGGVAVGLVAAFLLEGVLRYIRKHGFDDPAIASVVFLLAPFASYLPAEALHVSGVLAAVSAGILLSQRSGLFIDSETRLLGSSVWRLLTYVLNAFAFLLIGLQLPQIAAELAPNVGRYAVYGLILSAVVILVRVLWVFPAVYLPRLFSRKLREKEPAPQWQAVVVLSWSGMRGIVSLATALALPYALGDQPFPQRSAAIFFTICVVFVTLVGQGLTLKPLIEWLGITETSRSKRVEAGVRVRGLEAGLRRLRELDAQHPTDVDGEIVQKLLEEYEGRIALLSGAASEDGRKQLEEIQLDHQYQVEALEAERRAIMAMRNAGEIPDDVFRSIQYDLDLAKVRLA